MGVTLAPGSGDIEAQAVLEEERGRPKLAMDGHPGSQLSRQGLCIRDGISFQSEIEVDADPSQHEVADRSSDEVDRHPLPLSQDPRGLDHVLLALRQTLQELSDQDCWPLWDGRSHLRNGRGSFASLPRRISKCK